MKILLTRYFLLSTFSRLFIFFLSYSILILCYKSPATIVDCMRSSRFSVESLTGSNPDLGSAASVGPMALNIAHKVTEINERVCALEEAMPTSEAISVATPATEIAPPQPLYEEKQIYAQTLSQMSDEIEAQPKQLQHQMDSFSLSIEKKLQERDSFISQLVHQNSILHKRLADLEKHVLESRSGHYSHYTRLEQNVLSNQEQFAKTHNEMVRNVRNLKNTITIEEKEI